MKNKTMKTRNWKNGLFAVFFLIATTAVAAVSVSLWTNDKAHSQLQFTVSHLGLSDVSGMFHDFDVKVHSEKEDFSDAVFELTAQVASINTRVEPRDNHLRSADFFDAENYPTITYKSTSIQPVGDNRYKLVGDLTMRGVTKSVEMDLLYRGKLVDPESKKETVGFQLTGTLNRMDFNVGTGFGEPMISNEVRIKADGEFIKQ